LPTGSAVSLLRTVRRGRGREQAALAARLHAGAVADRDAGRLSPALAAGERVLKIVEHRPGELSLDAVMVWNTIGTIHEAMCDYDGAGSAYRRAAAILDRHKDDDSVVPARITVTSSSARLHRTLGRLDAAERLYPAAITAAEKHFGTGAVEVATLLNDLAVVYKYAARFDDAQALCRRALGIIDAARGPDHLDAATIWHNLGGVEHARGRFVDGEIYARRSVQIRETVLGPDHVAVAADLAALAALVQEQQRFDEAETLYRRAIAIFEAGFGPIHYELGVNYNNLGALHAARGDLREAENLYQRALGIKHRLLGHNHPDVAMTLHNLAVLYTQQGDNDRACDLFARAVGIFESSLGPEHPKTARSRTELDALAPQRHPSRMNKVDQFLGSGHWASGPGWPRHHGRRMPSLLIPARAGGRAAGGNRREGKHHTAVQQPIKMCLRGIRVFDYACATFGRPKQ
jgi:tetratricopeptide (TPR) repeat protein